MKMKALLSVAAIAAATGAQAVPVSWVDWDRNQDCNASGCTVKGTVGFGDETVGLTYHTTNTGFVVLNSGAGSETNYWTTRGEGGSPYTSGGAKGNDNGPAGSDMIGLSQGGTHTFTFDRAVSDIYFAFLSANRNTLSFSTTIKLLSSAGQDIDGLGADACGYWGCGTAQVVNDTDLTGEGELHGVALLEGEFTGFSFTNQDEYWHGFTFGAASAGDGGNGGEDPAPVPLPAGGLLLLGALGGLGVLRRKLRA